MEGGKQYIRSAQEYEAQGDKKVKGGFFKNIFSSKGERLDEARDLYEKAANSYKLGSSWEKAGQMYKKCAEWEQQTNGIPAQYIMDAVNCYKKVSSAEFLSMAEEAIRMLAEEGRINQAARLRKEVAENFEQQYEYEQAWIEYEKAAALYEMEESISFANQWYVKQADLMVLLKEVNFEKVIQTYEKVVCEYMK
jgi:alpha-soluble NSF attachment protein